jgi:flagellar protein FliO/FliZ
MLSAKSNVLKNYVNSTLIYFIASWAFIAPDAFSFSEQASKVESGLQAGPDGKDLLAMIMALCVVVACIVLLALAARRFNLMPGTGQQIKTISSLSLGGRERVVVIEIKGKQHAVGVSNGSVNYLFELEEPLDNTLSKSMSVRPNSPLLDKLNKFFGHAPTNPTTTKNKEHHSD